MQPRKPVHGESSVLEEPVNALDVDSILDSYEVGVTQTLLDTIRRRVAVGLTFTHRENRTTLGDRCMVESARPLRSSALRERTAVLYPVTLDKRLEHLD